MLVAPSITWLLVSTSPDGVRMIPVPAAAAFWYPSRVLTSTTPTSRLVLAVPVEALPLPFDGADGAAVAGGDVRDGAVAIDPPFDGAAALGGGWSSGAAPLRVLR